MYVLGISLSLNVRILYVHLGIFHDVIPRRQPMAVRLSIGIFMKCWTWWDHWIRLSWLRIDDRHCPVLFMESVALPSFSQSDTTYVFIYII